MKKTPKTPRGRGEQKPVEVCLMCEGIGRYPSGRECEICLGKGFIPKEWNE